MNIETVKINYGNAEHANALISLLDLYAQDPMGGGHPLNAHVKEHLVAELSRRPTAFGVLAFADVQPVGLINCFEGFSTFACKPLVNIHDLIVSPKYRGRQIAILMLEHVERIAKERGCCKLTLEVLQGNAHAQQLYRKFGFADYKLASEKGNAMFWQKNLDAT